MNQSRSKIDVSSLRSKVEPNQPGSKG